MGAFISVLIPCYNEEKVLDGNFQVLSNVFKDITNNWEICYCNDGSTDSTENILRDLAAQNDNIKIISYRPNRGPGKGPRVN